MAKNLSNNQLLMKECVHQEFLDFGLYEDENSYFEFFAASQVLKNYDLSDDELMSGIVGGAHDGGCDGLFVFLNNDLLTPDQIPNISAPRGSTLNLAVVQAKNTTGFNEEAIMKWKTVSTNLLDMGNDIDSFADRYEEGVRNTLAMFREVVTKLVRLQIKIHIHYYYVTLARDCHPNTIAQAEELKTIVKNMYPSANVDVTFVDADKLMELYNTETEVNVSLEFAEPPISRGKNTEYIAIVNLGTFYKFITDENGSLRSAFFEANVRDYQGKNAVNSSIAQTLENNEKEDFWWLNNGITIVAQNITPVTSKEVLITNPEIVNGLQTSTEIYNFYSVDVNKVEGEKRNVLVRILVPSDEESRDSIIFATNNQTNIPQASLRVTDAIHLQIEMYFKNHGLYYDRRKNFYKNQKKKASEIVGVSFLAQCLISIFLQKPDFARARPSTLLNDEETYKYLYENNTDLEVFLRAAILGKLVQKRLASSSDMSSTERNDILYYLLYAYVSKTVGKREISFSDVKLMDMTNVDEQLMDTLKSQIYAKYKELGGNSHVAKSPSFIEEVDKIVGHIYMD